MCLPCQDIRFKGAEYLRLLLTILFPGPETVFDTLQAFRKYLLNE